MWCEVSLVPCASLDLGHDIGVSGLPRSERERYELVSRVRDIDGSVNEERICKMPM